MKNIKNIMVVLLTLVAITVGSTASASAAGCKIYTNPPKVSYNANWHSPWGTVYPMGFSGTLYTGDSSSSCSDINVASVSGSVCSVFSGDAWFVVQYLSGGVWHTDDQGITVIPCNSSTLRVIGAGYANNTPFRVLIDLGYPASPWPTFKLYV